MAGSDLCVVVWVYAFCLACMVTIGIITGVAEKKKKNMDVNVFVTLASSVFAR